MTACPCIWFEVVERRTSAHLLRCLHCSRTRWHFFNRSTRPT